MALPTFPLGSLVHLDRCLETNGYPPALSHPFASKQKCSTDGGTLCCRTLQNDEWNKHVGYSPWLSPPEVLAKQEFLITTATALAVPATASNNCAPLFVWSSAGKSVALRGFVCLAWLVGISVTTDNKKYLIFPASLAAPAPTLEMPLAARGARFLRHARTSIWEPGEPPTPSPNIIDTETDLWWPERQPEEGVEKEEKKKAPLSSSSSPSFPGHHPLALLEAGLARIRVYRRLLRHFDPTRLASVTLATKAREYEDLFNCLIRPPAAPDQGGFAAYVLARGLGRQGGARDYSNNRALWTTFERLLARATRRLLGPGAWLQGSGATLVSSESRKERETPDPPERRCVDDPSVHRGKRAAKCPPRVLVELRAPFPEPLGEMAEGKGARADATGTVVFDPERWWDVVEDTLPRQVRRREASAQNWDGSSSLDGVCDRLFALWLEETGDRRSLTQDWDACIDRLLKLDDVFCK
jgi:hypothetical protein